MKKIFSFALAVILVVMAMAVSASAAGTVDVKAGKSVDVDSKVKRTVYTIESPETSLKFNDGWFYKDILRDMTDSYPVYDKYPIALIDPAANVTEVGLTTTTFRITPPHSIFGPFYEGDKAAGLAGIRVMWPDYAGIDVPDRNKIYFGYDFNVEKAGTYQITIIGTVGKNARGIGWMMDDGERRQVDGTLKTDGTEGTTEGDRLVTFNGEALTYELTAGKHTFYMLLNEAMLAEGASGRYNLAGFVVEPISVSAPATTEPAGTTAAPEVTKAPDKTTPPTSDNVMIISITAMLMLAAVSITAAAKKAKSK